MAKITKKYRIHKIHRDGSVYLPRDVYGNVIFKDDYDNLEVAQQALLTYAQEWANEKSSLRGHNQESYVILPVYIADAYSD